MGWGLLPIRKGMRDQTQSLRVDGWALGSAAPAPVVQARRVCVWGGVFGEPCSGGWGPHPQQSAWGTAASPYAQSRPQQGPRHLPRPHVILQQGPSTAQGLRRLLGHACFLCRLRTQVRRVHPRPGQGCCEDGEPPPQTLRGLEGSPATTEDPGGLCPPLSSSAISKLRNVTG